MSDLAHSLWKRWGFLEDEASTWDNHWQEIAERILPRHADFNQAWTKGEKRTGKTFDSTGQLALQRFTAAMDSMLTPQGQRWHGLRSSNPDLDKLVNVRRYFDEWTNILFRYRYSTKAAFATNMHETYGSLGAFGTGGLLVEPRAGGGTMYKCLALSKFRIAENSEGRVDTVFRKFKWSHRQAMQRWGEKLGQVECFKDCSNPDKEFEFLHVITPREDYDLGREDYKGMPFASYYLCMQARETILEEGGYWTMPVQVSRYVTAPEEKYGRSPAMMVLPEIKQLNEMEKTVMRAAHLATRPPLLLHDDLTGVPINLKPNALNVGGVSSDGRQMIQPLQTGVRPDIGLDMMDRKRQVVNDAFLITLFQILVETHTMSATEVIERAREKGALLAPTMSRQTGELLGPMIEREMDILFRQGIGPEPPAELLEAGGEFEIQYDSPLARAQRSEEALGFMRTMESITPLAQIDPNVLRPFDWTEAAYQLSEVHGMPSSLIKPREQVQAEMQQEAQMAQMQQMIEMSQAMADTEARQAERQQVAMAGPTGRI